MNQCPLEPSVQSLRFAEQDARKLRDVLTDRMTGAFGASDVTLITTTNASTENVKTALREAALATEEADLLLVYFSGHGFIPEWSSTREAYLATYDLDSSVLKRNPDLAIRTGFLQRDVFGVVRGSSILILDCCHAGSYQPEADGPSIVTRFYDASPRNVRRHSAFLACPAEASSRESDEYGHGVFTHYLLEGLRGKAMATQGQVTLDSLAGYLNGVGIEPPFGHSLQAFGEPIVLSRPGLAPARQRSGDVTSRGPLTHPMESAEQVISQLLATLFPSRGTLTVGSPEELDSQRLEIVRTALEADALAVAVADGPGQHLRAQLSADRTADHSLAESVRRLPSSCLDPSIAGQTFHRDPDTNIVVIPLKDSRALVVVSPNEGLARAGAPVAAALRRFLDSDAEYSSDPTMVEIDILTELREQFGPLPPGLSERVFHLYRKKIESLVMVFEPVVHLSHDVGIASYEALARIDTTATAAPGRLLDLAGILGPRFLIARDQILARRAINTYAEAHRHGPWRDDLAKPLSVNVSVTAITSEDYIAGLQESLREARWTAEQTTLEISEKDPISDESFRRHITRLAQEMHLRFAVDDFGVGYASLDRLAMLPITQIKIDPAILNHPLAVEELKLVVQVANHAFSLGEAAAPRPIILEGVESDSPVSLREIYEAGIKYIQGYIVGNHASADLNTLSEESRTLIRNRLGG